MEPIEGETWVIDTSSLIHVKELVNPVHRQDVLDAFTILCEKGSIVFPKEVLDELVNGTKEGKPDLPLLWAKKNRNRGCRFGPCYAELALVMNDPVARS